MKIIIAIDGFSACGKSTLAKQLAKQLHYHYIDTGAMYRAITLYLMRENISFSDELAIENALKNIKLSFELSEDKERTEIYLNGENVELNIRDLIIAEKVSFVSAIKAVRDFAVAKQQEMGRKKGIVMDGRDIGTVVFPNSELKIFMTAAPEIRVKRRYLEMLKTNPKTNIEDVKSNLELRDYVDSNREESPLKRAEDARLLDNSDLSPEGQLKRALEWAKEVLSKQIAI